MILTHLNVDVLFAWILNKEGKSILPRRVVGPIASLQKRVKKIIMLRIEFTDEKVEVLSLPCSL